MTLNAMIKQILFFLTSIVTWVGCTSDAPDINTLCLRDRIGNYIIKWEVDPPMEGMVKIYVSDSPDKFSKKDPEVYANINEGIATYVTTDNFTRKYFRLTFNDKFSQIVGARSVAMDNIQNLRDMGGYFNNRNRMIRWGKVYRSGDLSQMSYSDKVRFDKLGIKTIIDFRNEEEAKESPLDIEGVNVVHIPISAGDLSEVEPFLREGKVRKGDAIVYMQDIYLKFITDNSDAFGEALNVFTDKENYPILFSCTYGKDGTGFFAAMLLAALSVPEETMIADYMASNEYIDLSWYAPIARTLNPDAQEAITSMLSVNEAFINPILFKIRRDYETIDNFFDTALDFSERERDKLKDILLY